VYKFLCLLFFVFVVVSCKQGTTTDKLQKELSNKADTKTQVPDLSEFQKVENDVASKESTKTATENPIESKPVKPQNIQKEVPKKKPKPKPKAKPKLVKRPAITFEEPVYDFGEITEGDIIKHKFAFKNTGNAELIIKSAKASCGCTDPSYPFIGIAPGETGHIGVTYNSVSKDGPQKPDITIKTNVDDTSLMIYLSGTVNAKEKEEKEEKDSNN